jgi:hypothetical protein
MSVPRSLLFVVLTCVLVVGVGIVANPWIIQPDASFDPVGDGILIGLGVIALVACVVAWVMRLRAWRSESAVTLTTEPGAVESGAAAWSWLERALFLGIVALWIAMFWPRWSDPQLSTDDGLYIAAAATWADTRANLFTPFAEHLCPVPRVWTWLICAAFDEADWPRALATSGLALFASTFPLLYLFVRREFHSPALALVAVSLFALTPVHHEIVRWYSASQWSWSFGLLLASLLVVQSNRDGVARWQLALSFVLAAIGPFFYLVGLLIGPVTAVYLAARRDRDGRAVRLTRCVLPLAGTATFLAFFVPLKLVSVLASSSYGGNPALSSIDPLGGALYGVRCVVDLLVLRNLGCARDALLSRAAYATLFMLTAVALVELVRRARRPRFVLVGCALVILSYAISLPFRAWVEYSDFLDWTRYQLYPQLGVVLLVSGALATHGPEWLAAHALTGRCVFVVLALATAQFVVHVIA